MKTTALLALNSFIHRNKLGNLPLMYIIDVLHFAYTIQNKLGYFPDKFEGYLASLQGEVWEVSTWDYWTYLHQFQGELKYYMKTMPLEEAITTVIEEFDLLD